MEAATIQSQLAETIDMTEQHIQPVKQTRDYIDRWQSAVDHLKSLGQQVTSAQCELANATSDLGRHMAPKDAKKDEAFNIWFSDGLLEVTMSAEVGNGTFDVRWRQRPTKL